MTDPLFLADFDEDVAPGARVVVDGEEAHHAAVKRLAAGESVLLSNGRGVGLAGLVVEASKRSFVVEVSSVRADPGPALTWTVAQALAKGDRSELAVQLATEVGARRVLAWQASRSIVRWQGDRAAKSLERWRLTAREAAKQSRRLWTPEVEQASTAAVEAAIAAADVALVLHESAETHIADVSLPAAGTGVIVVGPEGGISDDELARFVAAGAAPVLISDGVLRTSSAAGVALGQLDVIARRAHLTTTGSAA
ncbi:MAG: 16S rRNA (uracil(1498)-N(3))-methyltransferase [Tessaracoccus sp.]|nr:16S rRNA (uracil(1498)-N(3))-methyltransferase [Tessaracoccus sp.]MBK7820561.1 16S rRNA (uracil(1498)-N(3))-methyltransferase [Tessaracoccus sp.]